ncbi:hypothetical protein PHYSODRAFT_333229 [Phytophthora sojae]|uniref:FYVE-type domain-containing protein n=1 Tax=Phytophthora sojae (strain P6497) TaxID=1094619 RepID=G4ZLP5_PHYSP|nr:hypothetical protein PHYSODRAFT_333229 [Phytophthora sojae]EGZ14938.1 hypothetical protein PHYSODRAFT_333229 [Phytophthora sojae]|eukprot:XP_009528687.1 hypothetical protein PHYSODRAFT_333229 [Phytophthora sojae]
MATPSSPFGPLQLSCTDTAWLQELVRLLVHEHILSYEKFVHQDQRLLNPTQWKRHSQRDNLQVYCQQQLQQQRENSSVGERVSRRRLFRDTEARSALAEMPTLLLVGTIQGSLNDVMYGVLNPTADSMRLKSSYVGDKFASCAVLATMERPTPSDPFRSHTLKWFEGDHPYIFRPIVKNRDFVFMEATGVTTLAGGERVGYHVMHSVTFPGAREMNGNVRAHMAVCAFYRQQSDGVVEVFTKTTANPGGHVAPAIAVKYGANALLSAQSLVDCAHAKKLAWVVSTRARAASTTSTCSSSSSSSCRDFRADSGGICFTCGERSISSPLLSRSGACTLCTRPICPTCRVKKSLRFVAWTGGVAKHKMKFCGPCVREARRLDARALACDEFGADRPQSHPRNRLTAHLEGLTASDPNVVVLRPSALSS